MDECGCMCVAAGHYGACQVVAERKLQAAPGQPVLVADSPVCRPCYDASLLTWMRPWPARRQRLMTISTYLNTLRQPATATP